MAKFQTVYFEDGNTVRKLQPEIDYEEFKRRQKVEEERKRRANKRALAAKARKKRLYSIYMSASIICAVCFFVGYVYMQSQVTQSANNIAELESEISSLKADNNAAEARISTGGNLSTVRDLAINDLGMVYANTDQIVYYDMETSDYMNQYKEIP